MLKIGFLTTFYQRLTQPNSREKITFIGILLIGAMLRFYRMRDYLVFLGDEGRDVLVVKRMLVDHMFTLLGPITSVGGMYLGPIYYYLITPFLWLFYLDPVGPAVMIALLSLTTIYLIYRIGQEFFDTRTGLIASLLYATSPLVVIYSRSSWNPNAVPLFATIIIYSLLQFYIRRNWKWIFLTGVSFGVIIQLHYLALLFVGVFIASAIIYRKHWRLVSLGLFICGFILTFSPFLLFEVKHGFPNTQTILRFITKGGSDATFSLTPLVFTTSDVLVRIFWRLVIIENAEITKIAIFLTALFYIYFYRHRIEKSETHIKALNLLFVWLVVALVAYGIYRGSIYDYYLVPVFPLPFLLVGFALSHLISQNRSLKIPICLFLIIVIFSHFTHSTHRQIPNRLLTQTEAISNFALTVADNQPYNFALISSGNSDHAYRYFFELSGKKPQTILNNVLDPERKSVMNQLIVVCEEKTCQPLGHSLWEVAGFGKAEVSGQWDLFTVKIFRLVHVSSS